MEHVLIEYTKSPPDEINYVIKTDFSEAGIITQEFAKYMGEACEFLRAWEMDTRERHISEALVALGWTPPDEGKST